MKKQIKQIFNPLSGSFDSIQTSDATKDASQLMLLTADEPISEWSNITGGFSISKVDPLFGDASYVLEMTDLKSATYKVIPVDIGFRGTTVALTLDYLMLDGAARVELLDQDNNLIDGAQFDIPAANGKEKFGTTVFIPSSVTGIRFKAESRATVAGGSFKFDNVQLSSDLLKSVDINDKWQQIRASTSFLSSDLRGNASLFKVVDANTIEFTSEADVYASATIGSSAIAGGNLIVEIQHMRGVTVIARTRGAKVTSSSNTQRENSGLSSRVLPGDTFFFTMLVDGTAGTLTYERDLLAKARTKSIVAPTDQVTERSIAFKFKSTALTASDPIGTYNTYTYAANTNTRTLATTRPTQTDADMSVNGFQIFTRAFNAASTAAQPARFEIKIAEPNQMAACDLVLNKNTSRTITGSIDNDTESSTNMAGMKAYGFNPQTGMLIIDAGWTATTITNHYFVFEDLTTQNNGYICFTASKLAQGVAIPTRKPFFRAVNGSAQMFNDTVWTNWTGWTVENDTVGGWDNSTSSYTIKESGLYSIQVQARFEYVSSTSADSQLMLINNGIEIMSGPRVRQSPPSSSLVILSPTLNTTVPLSKDDVLSFRIRLRGDSRSLDPSTAANRLSITKVGDL